jgi:hypothetical protein
VIQLPVIVKKKTVGSGLREKRIKNKNCGKNNHIHVSFQVKKISKTSRWDLFQN